MPTCRGCGQRVPTDALDRHQDGAVLRVTCPHCGALMGVYRELGRHSTP
ncbi:MAG: hypothetical protein U5K37_02370 [Natrialbaceae archaeon]|nr:hypothetical protein [Natrialbaceae archaeon]